MVNIEFNLNDEDLTILDYLELEMQHTSSGGKGEATYGRILVNDKPYLDITVEARDINEWGKPIHIEKEYFKNGANIVALSLQGTKAPNGAEYVWWVKRIKLSEVLGFYYLPKK